MKKEKNNLKSLNEAQSDLKAFDDLPKSIRDLLNYAEVRVSSEAIKSIFDDENLNDKGISRLDQIKRKIQDETNFVNGMAKLQIERMRREQATKNRRRRS